MDYYFNKYKLKISLIVTYIKCLVISRQFRFIQKFMAIMDDAFSN